MTTPTMISTTRRIALAGASVTPAILEPGADGAYWPAPSRDGPSAQEALGDRTYPQQARPRMRGQDWPDLALEDRLTLEDVLAARRQELALLRGIDVLDRPAVGLGVVALPRVVHHPLEHPGARAHALDGSHLALDREDRLHLERRADPGAGRTDSSTALEELERVDREPHLQLAASLLGPLLDVAQVTALSRRGRRPERHQPEPPRRGARAGDTHPLSSLAVPLERLGRLPRRLRRSREAAGDVDGHDVLARPQKRLVDVEEVADGRLGGRGQRLRLPQFLEEPRVVRDLGLRDGPVATEHDVQGHHLQLMPLHQLRREVGRAVRDDRDLRHSRAP